MQFIANIFRKNPDTNAHAYVGAVVLLLLIIQTVFLLLIYFREIPKMQENVLQAKNISEQTLYRVGALEQRSR